MNSVIRDKIDRMTLEMLKLYEYLSDNELSGAELQIAYRNLDRSHRLLIEARRIATEAHSEQGNVIDFQARARAIRSN